MKRTPLRRVSKKHARELREAAPIRRAYLESHPICEIRSPLCTGRSEHLHEIVKRSHGGSLTDEANTVAACDVCNQFVEGQPNWAREHGWTKRQEVSA